MKIGVNTRLLMKDRMEGIARFSHEVLSRMVIAYPEDQFYFFFDRDFDQDFIYAPNVMGIKVSPPTRHPILWYYWFEHRLPKLMDKLGIDVFLSMDGYNSIQAKQKKILVSHDLAFHHFPEYNKWSHKVYYQKYAKRFHQESDHIIAVSNATKVDIVDSYNIEPEKITVAYNKCSDRFIPIDQETKKRMCEKYSDGKPYLIYLGAIHPRKNISNLVKAFDVFCEQNHTHNFLLVGRWAWKTKDITRSIENMKYRDRLKIIPATDEPIAMVLAGAEALVYVSKLEGFGIPILEAMRCDVPVITSNVSSMPEVAGDAAILVDSEHPISIAEAMNQLVIDPKLRSGLIKKGRERRDHFSWEESVNIIYEIIQMVK